MFGGEGLRNLGENGDFKVGEGEGLLSTGPVSHLIVSRYFKFEGWAEKYINALVI